MKKLFITLFVGLAILGSVNLTAFSQQLSDKTASKILGANFTRLETTLRENHKVFKNIGDFKVPAHGKIVQKIKATDSIEIMAVPFLLQNDSPTHEPFKATLYAENGLMLSQVTSHYGLKMAAHREETFEPKDNRFELSNPNDFPVKVRFYIIQDQEQTN